MMPKTVFIVDDSTYMRILIKDALTSAGFEIIGEAANGESAIDQLMELNPDLITLDNILPDMLGTDILNVIRSEPKLTSKVIMISAVGNAGMDVGAEAYIVKPFTPEKLISEANRVLAF
jgi:two-component system chemotaxis response regulator CheY